MAYLTRSSSTSYSCLLYINIISICGNIVFTSSTVKRGVSDSAFSRRGTKYTYHEIIKLVQNKNI